MGFRALWKLLSAMDPSEAHVSSDAHAHHHHHEHHGAIDYTHANREYFDKMASTYDERPFFTEIVGSIGRAFLKEYDFNEEKTHVLDFACGTGVFANRLKPLDLTV